MDAGVAEAIVGIDGRHIIAVVQLVLIHRGNGPLEGSVLDIAFTDPDGGAAKDDSLRIDGADGDGAAGCAISGAIEGCDGGGGEQQPAVGVVALVDAFQHTVLLDYHSVQITLIGGSEGEFDSASVVAECGAAAGDVDGLIAVDDVANLIDVALASEEGAVELLGDLDAADAAVEDADRSVIPIAVLGDVPTEKTLGGGHVEIGDALEGHAGHIVNRSEVSLEVGARVGDAHLCESSGVGVEEEETLADGGHLLNLIALSVCAFARGDNEGAIVELDHAADREGDLFAIDIAGDVGPILKIVFIIIIETASSSTSIHLKGIIQEILTDSILMSSERHDRGDASANIVGSDFNEFVALIICFLGR